VVDQAGRIVAVLAGRPKSGDWQGTCTRAYDSLDKARESLRLPDDMQHRRGCYPSVNVGISYGRGQTHPMNLPTPEPVRQLLQDADVRRIAGFANGVFAASAPKLYKSYEEMVDGVLDRNEQLELPYRNSIFTATTFNFGPQVFTVPHFDNANLPNGWCTITSLGNFDPKKGGHLVLWELGLIIEFPPHSTVALPSASVPHANIPIQPHESRASLTCYAAGALFRYAAYGF
ncbi:hypothetical protein BV25DRAFT_1776950, partial [Artomyces pyxidatus]